MKLLFDENVSPRLVAGLSDVFPGSVHVRDVGLARATDAAVWGYAQDHDLAIVSKDSDFHQVSFVRGPPPKVIRIRRGNCTTADIKALLRSNRTEILAFGAEAEAAFLSLSSTRVPETRNAGSFQVVCARNLRRHRLLVPPS